MAEIKLVRMDEEVTAVCIDNGSGTIKAGFAGDEMPRSVIPTLVGKPKVPLNEKEIYIGREALSK
jgi:actin-related protein